MVVHRDNSDLQAPIPTFLSVGANERIGVPAKSGNTGEAQRGRSLQAYYLKTDNIQLPQSCVWGRGGGTRQRLSTIYSRSHLKRLCSVEFWGKILKKNEATYTLHS
jgi:hypothetical protein